MAPDSSVTAHYSGGDLLDAITAGVEAIGKTPATVTVEELAPVDEFHIGGRRATVELCDQLDIGPDSDLLDVGSGLGGAARFIAATYGCRATGIDITANYVDVGNTLTEWTGLGDRVRFEVANALDMPFDDGRFDRATQLHVGMNIADKTSLFAEVHRVLCPGGRFGVYDIVRTGDGQVTYPVPWASGASISHLADPAAYRQMLQGAGFEIVAERDRTSFALEFFAATRERNAETEGPPPLGLHLVLGASAPDKIANMVGAIAAGTLAPTEFVCHKPIG